MTHAVWRWSGFSLLCSLHAPQFFRGSNAFPIASDLRRAAAHLQDLCYKEKASPSSSLLSLTPSRPMPRSDFQRLVRHRPPPQTRLEIRRFVSCPVPKAQLAMDSGREGPNEHRRNGFNSTVPFAPGLYQSPYYSSTAPRSLPSPPLLPSLAPATPAPASAE